MTIMMRNMMNGMDIQFPYLMQGIMMRKTKKQTLLTIKLTKRWKTEG